MSMRAVLILEAQIRSSGIVIGCYEPGTVACSFEAAPKPADTINQLADEVRSVLSRACLLENSSSMLYDQLRKEALLLYDALLPAEVKQRLRKTAADYLTVVFDERMLAVPWEILFDGESFFCLRYAMGRIVKTEQPVVHRPRPVPNAKQKLLLLANPDDTLKNTEKEIMAISDCLSADDRVQGDFRCGQISSSFIKKNIRDYNIVHYAGHSQSDGLVLRDGIFSVQDILALGGSAQFPHTVFLHSCRSADSDPALSGENSLAAYNVANAFICSGVRCVVGTVCEIPDIGSERISCEFYRQIQKGLTVGEALRVSRQLESKRPEGSLIWAYYLLYGDPENMLLNPGKSSLSGQKTKLKLKQGAAFGAIIIACILILLFGFKNIWPARLDDLRQAVAAEDMDAVDLIAKKLLGDAEQKGSSFRQRIMNIVLARSCLNRDKYQESLFYAQKAVELSENASAKDIITAYAYESMAGVYHSMALTGSPNDGLVYEEYLHRDKLRYDNYKKALYYYGLALNSFPEEIRMQRSRVMGIIGLLQSAGGQYKDAVTSLGKAIKEYEGCPDIGEQCYRQGLLRIELSRIMVFFMDDFVSAEKQIKFFEQASSRLTDKAHVKHVQSRLSSFLKELEKTGFRASPLGDALRLSLDLLSSDKFNIRQL